jgi:myotubularin-related protein 1/2
MANRTTGGGYENDDNYKDCEINFLNIQNIHVMRESLRKIFDMGMPNSNFHHNSSSITNGANIQNRSTNANGINNLIHFSLNGGGNSTNNSNNSNLLNDDKNYFVNLENSKWLEHIRLLLNGALRIVKYIHDRNASVLVHCSDGWDRTSQLTSLSMLMMDKFYRTLKGFQVLVEKEWISFGHRFGIRMGHGSDKHSDQDRSPIFVQFIDAVWQIMQQNSKVFEFNEKFLLTILNNMYTCQFGTFLYNNELEREKHVNTIF